MANPTPPDLTDQLRGGYVVAFEPESHWQAGEYDPALLLAALAAQAPLAPFADDAGDPQAAVRLDADADTANVGYWISVPKGTGKPVVDAGVAAYPQTAADADQEAQTAAAADGNAGTLRDRLNGALDNLEGAVTGWGGLTAAQKDAALKLTVRCVAALVRLALRRLDAAP